MIKVNKILIIFFGGIFVVIFALFQFIETKTFTSYLLNPILKKITSPLGVQISVEHIDLQFFPPATYFEKIEVEKKNFFKLNLDHAGAVFRLSNFIRNDFNLHTIKLQGGLLKIKKGQHAKTEWGWDDIQLLKKIQHEVLKLWNQTKLGQIEISRLIVQRDVQSGMLHSAICTIDKDKIDMLFEAVDLKLGQLHLDGLRADLSLDAEKLEVSSLKIENDFNYFTYSGFIGILDASISGHVDLAGALSLLSEQFPQIQMKEVLDLQGNLKTAFLFYLSNGKKNVSNGEAELTDVKFRSKSFRRIAFGFSL